MYDYVLRKSVEKIFSKLAQKNAKQLDTIFSKIEHIVQNPKRFKNLRRPLQHLRRVHIDKSFVLVYSVDEENNMVVVEDFDHHDRIYVL